MKIKTPSDLKAAHEAANPDSLFFSRETMRFWGDTMRNFGVRQPVEVTTSQGVTTLAFELYRRRTNARNSRLGSYWFDAVTFARIDVR